MLFGYRVDQIDRLNLVNSVKKEFKVTSVRPHLQQYIPISRRLPIYYQGATPPRPDPGHLTSTLAGVSKRVATETPPPSRKLRREFARYVELWLRRNLQPLTQEEYMTMDEWLDTTTYSQERKRQLKECWERCGGKPTKRMLALVKSFVKDESYPEYKFPRGIYSRSDQAKCLFGPLVQSVSKKLFNMHWFIKKIPVADRPRVIYDKLFKPNASYTYTDYTSFEAHFTAELMNICENKLYKHSVSRLSKDQQDVAKMMAETKVGTNKIIFKTFNCQMEAGRMSGEMDTSASNGFTNLMLYLFASNKAGCEEADVHGFVEGDDGIFRNDGPAPDSDLFKSLGMTIKIGVTKTLETASFCGQIYDIEDMAVVTDVKEVVARLGWTNKKYVRAGKQVLLELLRSRGFSLVYQYGRCPILGKLGQKILELTSKITVRQSIIDQMDGWEKERYYEALKYGPQIKEPGLATRQLVEKMYDLPVKEQLDIEEKIENMTTLGPLPFVFETVPKDWMHYYEVYSVSRMDEKPIWINSKPRLLIARLVKANALTDVLAARLLRGGDGG